MVITSDFRLEDQRKLDAMLAVSSVRAGHPLTFENLVARWSMFVAELQRGRRFSRQDFERALSARGILEELGECLSTHGRQMLLTALLDADRRFLALTGPSNGQLKHPWWHRYPPD